MGFPKEKEDLMRQHLKNLDMTTLDAVMWMSHAFSSLIIAIQVHDKELHEKLSVIMDEGYTDLTTVNARELSAIAGVIAAPLVIGAIHEST